MYNWKDTEYNYKRSCHHDSIANFCLKLRLLKKDDDFIKYYYNINEVFYSAMSL